MRIDLKIPVSLGDEEVTFLEMREPRAKDMRSIKIGTDMTIGDLLDLAATLASQPRPVLDLLSPRDTVQVVQAVGKLLDLGGVAP